MNSLDFGMAFSSWIGDCVDPSTFLDLFLTQGGNNRTGWSSEAYDQYINQSVVEVDPAKRLQLLRQAEELLIRKEVPITPLFFGSEIQLYDPKKLGGIEGNLLDKHPLWQIYKREPK